MKSSSILPFVLGCFWAAGSAFAQNVGYMTYSELNGSVTLATTPAPIIAAAGYTPVQVSNFTTFNLNTVQGLVINNGHNSGTGNFTSRLTDITNWVAGGGILMVHDRYVSSSAGVPASNPFLIGAPTTLATRSFSDGSNINLLPAGQAAFPSLDNSSLDGGNWSSHGFVSSTLVPPGSVHYLSTGTAGNLVALRYSYGLGSVYYSTIPLDFYIAGNNAGLTGAFTTYMTLMVAENMGLVPEPSQVAVIAGALVLGFVLLRRRRA